MSKQYLLIFYTAIPKPPELYHNNTAEMSKLFKRITELTQHKAKFVVYELGDCLVDMS